MYINDLVDENLKFGQVALYTRLRRKTNWLSEISILLQSIPNNWKQLLNSANSQKTVIKIITIPQVTTKQGKQLYIDNIEKQMFYKILIERKFEKSYVEQMWSRQFNLKTVGIWKHIWNFTYKRLKENKLELFKFRLIYCILLYGELLCK